MTTREKVLDYIRFASTESYPGLFFTGPCPYTIPVDTLICERPLHSSGYDAFGVHWTSAVPSSHRTPDQPPVLTDIEDWDQVKVPDVSRFDWDRLARDTAGLDRSEKLVSATLLMGPFERTSVLSSFEDCLVNAITEPECYSDLIGKIADYKIALIDRLYQAAHPDVINLHDDWGTARSTFMSPELWRETIRPHTQRIYDAIHDRGMLVSQHSCGQISTLIPDLIEMGADLWEAQITCYDLPQLLAACEGKVRVVCPELAPDPGMSPLDTPQPVPEVLPQDMIAYPDYPDFLI